MCRHLVLAFFSLTSARICDKKDGFDLYNSQSPEAGTCQEKGLGWKGRIKDSDSWPNKDQFFTKWTELFSRPWCIDKIEVHISYPDEDEQKEEITPAVLDFSKVNSTQRNPSNTLAIIDQKNPGYLCTREAFKSRIKFVPKSQNQPCFELTREFRLRKHQSLADHFLNGKGPTMERAKDGSGVYIFWRRGMVDTCVQAVEWTLNENTTRIEEKQSKSRDEDSIFITAKCEAQNVTLTYIFSDTSDFKIADKTLKLEVEAFPENKECQLGEEGSESSDNEESPVLIIVASTVGGITFALLTALVSFCLYVRNKRRNMVKVDVSDIYGTYYEGEVEYTGYLDPAIKYGHDTSYVEVNLSKEIFCQKS